MLCPFYRMKTLFPNHFEALSPKQRNCGSNGATTTICCLMPLKELYGIFPRLANTQTLVTSPIDVDYNCVGWAIGDRFRWWEPYGVILPSPSPPYRWPEDLPHNKRSSTYVRFFELHGYQVAYDDSVEPGFRKIAIYVENDEFRHVARQEPNGLWSSKIGPQEDITHELRALESSGLYGYGVASIFMKKS